MRIRQWLSPKLASLAQAIATRRLNPRALVFGAACWLLWSGVREFSEPAARITLGIIFLVAIFWPERRAKGQP